LCLAQARSDLSLGETCIAAYLPKESNQPALFHQAPA
jgi:hypothetical protein